MRRALALAIVALAIVGCDKAQPLAKAPAGKADTQPWDMAQSHSVAPGWQSGDKASWEAQMRTRAQGQNEYSRVAAVSATPAKAP